MSWNIILECTKQFQYRPRGSQAKPFQVGTQRDNFGNQYAFTFLFSVSIFQILTSFFSLYFRCCSMYNTYHLMTLVLNIFQIICWTKVACMQSFDIKDECVAVGGVRRYICMRILNVYMKHTLNFIHKDFFTLGFEL